MTYTIERWVLREHDSLWLPMESFEDEELAKRELRILTARWNDSFRIVTDDPDLVGTP